MQNQKVILITGCSSGIGQSLARALHARGHRVYASARRPESLAPLVEEGMRALALDVNEQAQIDAAIAQIASEAGRLDIVVNNAGYGQFGAVADLDVATLERQFRVNVIAPVQVMRAALPLLRASATLGNSGLVVNIGSVSGILTTPFAGAYCASKAAVHALTEAMRMELAPLGVRALCVQPGAIASPFGANGKDAVALPAGSLYEGVRDAVMARANASQNTPTPASEFTAALADAMLRDVPPLVFRGGRGSWLLPFLKRWMPERLLDGVLAKKFGLGGARL